MIDSNPLNSEDMYEFLEVNLISCAGARSTLHCATSEQAPHEAKKSKGYFSADCKPEIPSNAACNPKLSDHVWKFSAHAVDLPAALDPLGN